MLLVVTLGHVREHVVGGLVDVVDDLAKVGLEVGRGESFKVGEGGSGDVPLPLQLALALIDSSPQAGVFAHIINKGLGDLQLVGRDGSLAAGQPVLGFVLIGPNLGQHSGLTHVGGEGDQVEILVDVVHDLGLEEHLSSIVHNLVAELGLGDVLSQLLDSSAAGLGRTVLVHNLVALPLAGFAIWKSCHQLLDNLELSPEESVLVGVHDVAVHLEQAEVHAWHGFYQTLERGGELELFEETGGHAGGGGAREADLVVEDDGGAGAGPHQGAHQGIEIRLIWGSRVADGNPHVDQARELLLQAFHHIVQRGQSLHLQLFLHLVDVDHLELSLSVLHPSFTHTHELRLVFLESVPGHVAELSVLPDLVGRAGADGLTVNIDARLLAQVEPDDLSILGVNGAGDFVEGGLEASNGWLTAQVDLVSRHTAEVWATRHRVRQLLDLLEVVRHGSRLPYLGVVRHPESGSAPASPGAD